VHTLNQKFSRFGLVKFNQLMTPLAFLIGTTFGSGCAPVHAWYTKQPFRVLDVYWIRCVPLSEGCTLRMHVHVYGDTRLVLHNNFVWSLKVW